LEQQHKLQAFAQQLLVACKERLRSSQSLQQEQRQPHSAHHHHHVHKKTKRNASVVGDNYGTVASSHPPDSSPSIPKDLLCLHGGITTNLGGLLYYEGDCVMAVHLFQESVQALMCMEASSQAQQVANDDMTTTI
jgi:hypothetical protein